MTPFVRPPLIERKDRVRARSVFLILLGLYTATFTGLPDNPDAEVEFQTTRSLARRGSYALGDTPEARALIEATPEARGGLQGFNVVPAPTREGVYYSWFGVGQALSAIPLYVAGSGLSRVFPEYEERHRATTHYGVGRSEYFEHLLVGWRNPLFAALTAWLLVGAARRVGASGSSAWLGALSYGMATFAWPQARSTLSDVQATFCLFLAFALLLRVREGHGRLRPLHPLEIAGIGAALGAAFLTRIAVAPAALALFVISAMVLMRASRDEGGRRHRIFDLVRLSVPVLAALAYLAYANELRFDDPFETGYGAALGDFFSESPHVALAGLLLSPGKGLLWMAPGVLLVGVGTARARARGEGLWPWTLFVLALAVIAPLSATQSWHGAWTYGPRYLLPLLPFAWLGVPLAFDRLAQRPFRRGLAVALVVSGLLVSFPGVLVDHPTHEDLALQAARVAWPEVEGANEAERDAVRFERIHWDMRFAAPWAHWRILRHRVAGLDEAFPLREIYFLDDDRTVTPAHERDRGFRHLAWVDFQERLGGPTWPAALLCLVLLGGGLVCAAAGMEPG